eukprot:1043471-Amphidinium_carterae.1
MLEAAGVDVGTLMPYLVSCLNDESYNNSRSSRSYEHSELVCNAAELEVFHLRLGSSMSHTPHLETMIVGDIETDSPDINDYVTSYFQIGQNYSMKFAGYLIEMTLHCYSTSCFGSHAMIILVGSSNVENREPSMI